MRKCARFVKHNRYFSPDRSRTLWSRDPHARNSFEEKCLFFEFDVSSVVAEVALYRKLSVSKRYQR